MKTWKLKVLMPDRTQREFRVGSNSYQSVVDSLAERYPGSVILNLQEEKES